MLEFLITALFTFSVSLLRMFVARRLNHTGKDVHKGTIVPESGGIALLLGIIFAFFYFRLRELKRFFLTLITLGLIGLVDDLIDLGPKTKTVLSFLAGIFALKSNPLYLETFWGKIRAENLYRIAIPAGYGIYANATNMYDVVNSVTVVSTAMILSFQAFLLYLLQRFEALTLSLIFLTIVLAYLPFNLYPAHMFNGDVGDFILGGMIFTVALYGHIEIPTLIATIPLLTNGIIFIFTAGLKTRRQFQEQPTRIDQGRLMPNFGKNPKTLTRAIASIACGVNEKDLIKYFLGFFAMSILTAIAVVIII